MGTAEKVVPFLIPQIENKINKKLSCCTTNCPVRKYERTERKIEKERELRRDTENGGNRMERVYERCCGIDVHKKLTVAYLRTGKQKEIREFGACTRELLLLADWLQEQGCEMVAMESTGSYWKPLYNVLEAQGLPAMVVKASHCRGCPFHPHGDLPHAFQRRTFQGLRG